MVKRNEIQIIIKAVDKASKTLGGIGGAMSKLGKVAGIAGAAVLGVATGVGIAAYKMAEDAADVEKTRKTWDSLARSLGETGGNIESLREATRGMVNDADLMASSSKLMSMGLAGSNAEAAKLLEVSTQLGSAMGLDATTAAEDFALMLANQSIPRLDSFGISSGVVRQRIEELMEADKNLTREQAFMNAVMEQAEITMGKVGEQGEGTSADMARLRANVDNLKTQIGEKFLPVLAVVSDKLVETWNDPKIQDGISNVLDWLEKVIGDENSGVVGVITRLFEGDIAGAFDMAFGPGTWAKIEKFIKNFQAALGALRTVAQGVISVLQYLITMYDNVRARQAAAGGSQVDRWSSNRAGVISQGSQVSRWGRAGGGVAIAGKTYPVGERGMELFTPRVSGTITPSNRVAMGGANLNLTVHINSAVNLADRNYAERELMPYIEAGVRKMIATGAIA